MVVLPVLAFLHLTASQVRGQDADPPLDKVLAKTRASFATFNSALPSIDCDESLVSFETRDGKKKREQKATTVIQVRRQEGNRAEPYKEERTFTSVNGKTYPAETTLQVPFPLIVNGAFGDDFSWLISEDAVSCNRYQVLHDSGGLALKVTFRQNAAKIAGCDKFSTTGVTTFLLDRATWQLLRVEVFYPQTKVKKYPTEAMITDFVVKPFGEKSYMIPAKVSATMSAPSGNDLLVYSAEYSNCHKFDATMRILPDPIETPR